MTGKKGKCERQQSSHAKYPSDGSGDFSTAKHAPTGATAAENISAPSGSLPIKLPAANPQTFDRPTSSAQQSMPGQSSSKQGEGAVMRGAKPAKDVCTYQSPRVQTTSQKSDVATKESSEKKWELMRAQRPGYSTAMMRRIELITNFYQIQCNTAKVYHYDVDIVFINKKFKDSDRKPPRRDVCHRVISKLFKTQQHLQNFRPVYDGNKNLITARPLPICDDGENFCLSVPNNDKEEEVSVCIKAVVKKTKDNAIDMSLLNEYVFGKSKAIPNEVRMVLEILLAYRRPDFKQINVRNAFYWIDDRQRVQLDGGYEIWQGYSQSIRFSEKGAAVVINMAHSVFHKSGPITAILQDILRRPINSNTRLNPQQISRLNHKVRNLSVEVTHQAFRRKYKVQGLAKPACEQKFKYVVEKIEKMITVQDFFRERYKMSLKYPLLPCLQMKNRDVFMPVEVCDIVPGQRVLGKMDARTTSKMIREAAVPPDKRFEEISKSACSVANISKPFIEEFQMSMSLDPVQVTGRVLEQPQIQYSNNSCTKPNEKGVWDTRGRFAESSKALNWMLVSFMLPDEYLNRKLRYFADLLCRNGAKCGMELKYPFINNCNSNVESVFQEIDKKGSQNKPQFLVFVLSTDDGYPSYEEVKFFGDITYGIVTQCVESSMVVSDKMKDQVAGNICLKINAKLGGVNHYLTEWPLALRREVVMILGADVVHSINSPCPSIAAVVGTIDYNLMKYAVCCRGQSNMRSSKRNQEIIIDLKDMIMRLLKAHYKSSGLKPKKILFYRDGVSEGQFQYVLEKEIPMVKDACRSLQADYQPTITFVVVQKRHQVRLKPKHRSDGIGRHGNVPAGTTVDTVIVDPKGYDFYLCSHEGIQGTSKPSLYTVLFDENHVKPEVMENLTYYLCHMSARCNRSISIPAPVKYADLLAYRANNYIKYKWGSNKQDLGEEVPKPIKEFLETVGSKNNALFFI